MKSFRYTGLIMGFIILLSTNSKAQYYFTSYGYAQEWYLPNYVHHTIYDNYRGFEVAHVKRYDKHGHHYFNVLLHRNGWFLELRMDDRGHIYKRIKHRYHNPLLTHQCKNHCGYHIMYYQNYYPKYHKTFYGYKTTIYVNSNKGNHQNKHYKKVYVVHNPKQKNNQRMNNSNKQQKIREQENRRNVYHIDRSVSTAKNIQYVNNRHSDGQNTSRGKTRIAVAQRNEGSSRKR